ncbi:MAG: 6-carboxytetrahydropterin synthase QueD [Proteobacteria bacterium]|nr:6-carboxytetrahydropterin synthase QueD [Pseudomonadota bacterium]
MTWRLKVRSGFSAAHRLVGSGGKCESLHGHNFRVDLEVEGEELGDAGMVVDFGKLKGVLREVLEELDHRDLNEIGGLRGESPSSETIARYIFRQVRKKFQVPGVAIHSVTVAESDTAWATYFPGEIG